MSNFGFADTAKTSDIPLWTAPVASLGRGMLAIPAPAAPSTAIAPAPCGASEHIIPAPARVPRPVVQLHPAPTAAAILDYLSAHRTAQRAASAQASAAGLRCQ